MHPKTPPLANRAVSTNERRTRQQICSLSAPLLAGVWRVSTACDTMSRTQINDKKFFDNLAKVVVCNVKPLKVAKKIGRVYQFFSRPSSDPCSGHVTSASIVFSSSCGLMADTTPLERYIRAAKAGGYHVEEALASTASPGSLGAWSSPVLDDDDDFWKYKNYWKGQEETEDLQEVEKSAERPFNGTLTLADMLGTNNISRRGIATVSHRRTPACSTVAPSAANTQCNISGKE